jgi:hypothetical protein
MLKFYKVSINFSKIFKLFWRARNSGAPIGLAIPWFHPQISSFLSSRLSKPAFKSINNHSHFLSFQQRGRLLLVSSVVLLLISQTVTCRPSTQKSNKLQSIGFQKAYDSNLSTEDSRLEKCNIDMDLNELCQRCEKISEAISGDVFAMCCSNEDKATEYCRNYVYYGVEGWGDR